MATAPKLTRRVWSLSLLLFAFSLPAAAQHGKDGKKDKSGGAYEEFEEIDPYTENDPAKFAKLGYVQVGSFGWGEGNRTEDVQEVMGGLDFLWVETEHFRIGSSLATYKITNDRVERARLKKEFAQMKTKLKRFKAPRRELDPWIRLHLYAQRAENLYAQYVEDFGLEALADDKKAPYLGHPKKFRLLLCQRKSELVRYMNAYETLRSDISCGSGKRGEGMLFALNLEAVEEGSEGQEHEPLDAKLYCRVISGLARSFVDGHSQELYRAPRWFVQAVDQYYARQADKRWVLAGFKFRNVKDKHWEWQKRVENLVKNDFYVAMVEAIRWGRDDLQDARQHIVGVSKLEFMIAAKGGQLRAYLDAAVVPFKGKTEDTAEELDARQRRALKDGFGLEPEEFDQAWLDWLDDR